MHNTFSFEEFDIVCNINMSFSEQDQSPHFHVDFVKVRASQADQVVQLWKPHKRDSANRFVPLVEINTWVYNYALDIYKNYCRRQVKGS